MLNQATLSGRIGRIRWVDANVGLVRIAQNFPDRPAQWFDVMIPSNLVPAALAELSIGAEVVFTGRLESQKKVFGRAKVDVVQLVANSFVVGRAGRGAAEGEVKFVRSKRISRLLEGEGNAPEGEAL